MAYDPSQPVPSEESPRLASQPFQPPTDPWRPVSQPFYPPQPQPYYSPPLPPKRRGGGWMVATLILLFLVLPSVASAAYQAGKNSANLSPVTTNSSNPGAADTTTSQEVPTQPPSGTWSDLKKWTGTNNQQTEVFTTPTEWRIVWSETATAGGAAWFYVVLYTDAGQKVDTVAEVTNQNGNSTYNAHALAGSFYLKIQADTSSYTIEVQVPS